MNPNAIRHARQGIKKKKKTAKRGKREEKDNHVEELEVFPKRARPPVNRFMDRNRNAGKSWRLNKKKGAARWKGQCLGFNQSGALLNARRMVEGTKMRPHVGGGRWLIRGADERSRVSWDGMT